MVMDVQRRYHSMEPLIDKFAVLTPPVVSLDFPSLMFSSLDPAEIRATKTTLYRLFIPHSNTIVDCIPRQTTSPV